MDWDLAFVPLDDPQLAAKAGYRNSNIELVAKVGKGVASIPIPVLVSEMEFTGRVRVCGMILLVASNIDLRQNI